MYTDYRKENGYSWLEILNGTITDYSNKIYTNGIIFCLNEGKKTEIDFPLNGQYSTLTGTIVLPKSIQTTLTNSEKPGITETDVVIYDEDIEIFRINGVTASMPYKFEVPVTGVNSLTIAIVGEYRGINNKCHVVLTDLALYK